MAIHICSIIAKNYLAFARTLAASFREHHPDGTCHLLVIDGADGYLDPAQEPFELVGIEELGIPRLKEFCFKYNITELSTALKPFLLEYLLKSQKLESLLYLDPDIMVTHPLEDLCREFEGNDILLTPHLDLDYPDDGLQPDDGHIMRSGIFNLGFIGVRDCANADRFLTWWKGKLMDKCVIEPLSGYFVDQKFIDLASLLFPNIKVIRDRGYNAAYWNLHSREIHKQGERWMCNDGILYFYHFSNYKPECPDVLSGHQSRYRLAELPGLSALFSLYTARIMKNGYQTVRLWPYGYAKFTNGRPIHDSERVEYRLQLPASSVPDPFVYESHSKKYLRKVAKKAGKRRRKAFRRRIREAVKAPFLKLYARLAGSAGSPSTTR